MTRASNVAGVRTNVVGDLVGVGAELRRWEHRVHHAQFQRPRRGDLLVQEVEAPGQRRPADAGPEDGTPVVARQAVGREAHREDGILGGEAQVAGGGQAAAGADGRAAHHGDGRLGHHVQQHGGVEVVAGQIARQRVDRDTLLPAGSAGAVLDVTARAEASGAALGRGTGQDDHLDLGVVGHVAHGGIERADQLAVQRVPARRPVQGDRSHSSGHLGEEDRFGVVGRCHVSEGLLGRPY